MINCKELSQSIKDKIKDEVKNFVGTKPGLAVIQVGDDPASNAYISGKKKDCEEVGFNFFHYRMVESSSTEDILSVISNLNVSSWVHGIIVQLPLPSHIDKDKVISRISKPKDVDGFVEGSPFSPCTATGVMEILNTKFPSLEGQVCTVVGRGNVGSEVSKMLEDRNATVIKCNSHTSKADLEDCIKISDIVVSATGKKGLIKYCEGQLIVDVGITRGDDGKLYGDVDKSLYREDNDITPVPGGVGLMTRAILIKNVFKSFSNYYSRKVDF